MNIHYPNIEENIIPLTKAQIIDKYPLHFGLDPIVDPDDIEKAMDDYAMQQAILFCKFRDTYQRYERQRMDIYHKKIGGLTSWIGTSDKKIYEAFLKGEQLENPLIKYIEEQNKNNAK